jgi:hypothetical protein
MADPTAVIDTIIGRALRDLEFREQFVKDPLKAAQDAGYSLTEEDKVGLAQLNKTLAQDFIEKALGTRNQASVAWCTNYRCYQVEVMKSQ